MRKIIFNTSFIHAITSGWSTIQATRRGPRDWRLVLLWASWAISTALAVGSIVDDGKGEGTRKRLGR